jgi:hypothetical protein
MDMTPLHYRNGNQHLHRRSADYRNHVRRKMRAYHVFIQAGVVAQGLLQYLAVVASKLVWDSFGSWLRTIRPGTQNSSSPTRSGTCFPIFFSVPQKTVRLLWV